MQWDFVVTLILAIPIIILPAALLWYLNTGSIGPIPRAARWRQPAGEERAGVVAAAQRLGRRSIGERYRTDTVPEEVGMEPEKVLPTAIEDYLEGRGTVPTAVRTGVRPELDDDGYMVHPELWTEQTAQIMAQDLVPGELTPEHWRVVHYLRTYYLQFGTVPPVRKLCRDTGLSLKEMYEMFPGNRPRRTGAGLAKCACKIAGMPWLSYKQYP
jgi:tRNA 2-thiouridine synthesizing protein E